MSAAWHVLMRFSLSRTTRSARTSSIDGNPALQLRVHRPATRPRYVRSNFMVGSAGFSNERQQLDPAPLRRRRASAPAQPGFATGGHPQSGPLGPGFHPGRTELFRHRFTRVVSRVAPGRRRRRSPGDLIGLRRAPPPGSLPPPSVAEQATTRPAPRPAPAPDTSPVSGIPHQLAAQVPGTARHRGDRRQRAGLHHRRIGWPLRPATAGSAAAPSPRRRPAR